MKAVILSLFLILLSLALGDDVWADWKGPQEIVKGTFGTGIGQFYYSSRGTSDTFPREIGVDVNGVILISDPKNKRVALYNTQGGLEKYIVKPPSLPTLDDKRKWPSSFEYCVIGNSILVPCKYEKVIGGRSPKNYCFVDYNSKLIEEIDLVPCEIFPVNDGYMYASGGERTQWEKFRKYSPTGKLLKTYMGENPLELGQVKERKIGSGQYEVTVSYPDKEWKMLCASTCSKYVRDTNNNLYCWFDRSVSRYNDAGEEIARVTMPKDNIERIPMGRDMGVEDKLIYHAEYGQPVVAPNGDVYTWKRGTDSYSIIKWTWED